MKEATRFCTFILWLDYSTLNKAFLAYVLYSMQKDIVKYCELIPDLTRRRRSAAIKRRVDPCSKRPPFTAPDERKRPPR